MGWAAVGILGAGLLVAAGVARAKKLQFDIYCRKLVTKLKLQSSRALYFRERAVASGVLEPAQTFDELPKCVQGYLSHAVREPPSASLITLHQSVQLRFSPNSKWLPLDALQRMCPIVPAFLFTGWMNMGMSTLWAMGFESLVNENAHACWKMWGVVPLTDATGPVAAKAAHVRWLAEAACCPQALLPSAFLRWEAVEGHPSGKCHWCTPSFRLSRESCPHAS